MTAIRAAQVDDFVRKPPADAIAILIYGSEPSAVHDRAETLVRGATDKTDDSFNIVRLDESALANDPSRLADEFYAMSMLGGRRVIWVREADRAFGKAVEPLLASPAGDSIVIAEAGNLAKTSALRGLFEGAKSAYALPCYENSERDLHRLIESMLQEEGLTIEVDAEKKLIDLLAADRLLSRSEISKLALYARGKSAVQLADVLAVCGDSSADSLDDLTDAVMEGNMPASDNLLTKLSTSGAGAGSILTSLAMHVARLQQLRTQVDRGRSPDEAIRAARPPIFFKRTEAAKRQLQLWSTEGLVVAGSSLFSAIRQCRERPTLDQAIANRTLLALARSACAFRIEQF